jgi:aminoglycoside 3-N-acetyltransferase
LDYIRQQIVFDVKNTPSKLGAITEYFRSMPNVRRSVHPTEPVAALGKFASYFTDGHLGALTPYNRDSPFYRLTEKNGKILYIGVTLSNAGTSLHLLEDAVDFHFPVYFPKVFEVDVIDENDVLHRVQTKVHHPEMSVRRRCDELLPHFEKDGIAQKIQIGKAETWLFDAKKMLDWMIHSYQRSGVTMYTPNGKE